MDLKRARTFVAVAELGTVSRAAQVLRIAQPALSRQIADLEAQLGVTLFDRVGRRLLLTGQGEQLLGDCRALLSAAVTVTEHAHLLRQGDTGVLKVAGSPQIIEGAVASFLTAYSARFPGVQVKLREAIGWDETATMLERGDIHLGINLKHAIAADDPRFQGRTLGPVDLLAASPASAPIGRNGKIDIAEVARFPLLVLETSYVFRRNFDAACRLAGVSPNVVYESRTPHTLLVMAECGHGVAIIPSVLRTRSLPLSLAAVTFRNKPLREHSAVYWDRRRPRPGYASAFCEMLDEHMRATFPISRPTDEGATGR